MVHGLSSVFVLAVEGIATRDKALQASSLLSPVSSKG